MSLYAEQELDHGFTVTGLARGWAEKEGEVVLREYLPLGRRTL